MDITYRLPKCMYTSTVQCLPRFPPYYPTILHYIHNLVDLTQSWYSHLSINSCILFIPFCATLYITADFFKSATGLVAYTIASISKDASVDHELFNPGKGVLVLLQKPDKPIGPLTNLRPIVLFSILRNTLSLIV